MYFSVQRNTIYDSFTTVIPYEKETLNIGGAMDLESGVFTAPTKGIYLFTFTTNSCCTENNASWIRLRLNEEEIATSYVPDDRYSMPLSVTIRLEKGDEVDVYLYLGSLLDDDGIYHFTHFSGILLDEDIEV